MHTLFDRKRIGITLAGLLSLFLPAVAAAQFKISTPSSVTNFQSLAVIIPRFFNIAIGVSGVLFVGLLLLGGVQYLVSLGEEGAVTKARKLMLNAGIGLVIVITSWALGNYVLQLLGITVNLTAGTPSGAQTSVGGGALSGVTSGAGLVGQYADALNGLQQAKNDYLNTLNNPSSTSAQIATRAAAVTQAQNAINDILSRSGSGTGGALGSNAQAIQQAQAANNTSWNTLRNSENEVSSAYEALLQSPSQENQVRYDNAVASNRIAQDNYNATEYNLNAETQGLSIDEAPPIPQQIDLGAIPDEPTPDQSVISYGAGDGGNGFFTEQAFDGPAPIPDQINLDNVNAVGSEFGGQSNTDGSGTDTLFEP